MPSNDSIPKADALACHPPARRVLTALPVYNEAKHLTEVLDKVVQHADHVLVVDDGSTDGGGELLAQRGDILCVRHASNLGYGAALKTAFDFAIGQDFDVLVTIDCDGQHEPELIGGLAAKVTDAPADQRVDIVSGSRYLEVQPASEGSPPADRRRINQIISGELNERLGLNLTDAFCGFKAYRVESLAELELTEAGYAMPLELWVQAARRGLNIEEAPVPLIYLDEERSFGGALDQAETRLAYYRDVIRRACKAAPPIDALCTSSACAADPCGVAPAGDATSC